jgi:hypothetical protein
MVFRSGEALERRVIAHKGPRERGDAVGHKVLDRSALLHACKPQSQAPAAPPSGLSVARPLRCNLRVSRLPGLFLASYLE